MAVVELCNYCPQGQRSFLKRGSTLHQRARMCQAWRWMATSQGELPSQFPRMLELLKIDEVQSPQGIRNKITQASPQGGVRCKVNFPRQGFSKNVAGR